MKNKPFSIRERIKSFVHAFNGLVTLFKEEHNARIHLIAAFIAIVAGFGFKINTQEWIAVVLSIGLVITVEAINSAIENIADFLTIVKNEKIKKIKDLAAAAVLISAFVALTIGLIIFLPKIALLG